MQVEMKVLLSIVILLAAFIFIALVKRVDRDVPDIPLWRLGAEDPLRRMIAHPDGSFRKFVKPLFGGVCLAILAGMWTFA